MKMEKKATIYSVIPWVLFLFIVVVVMTGFLLGVAFMANKDIVFGKSSEIRVIESDVSEIEEFIDFLNNRVEFKGKNVSIGNLILLSVEPYFEIKNYNGKSLIEVTGIEGIKKSMEDLNSLGFDVREIAKIKKDFDRSKIADKIKYNLDKKCENYRLEIPQGIIGKEGFKTTYEFHDVNNFDEWSRIVFPLYLNGYEIKLRYMELKKC